MAVPCSTRLKKDPHRLVKAMGTTVGSTPSAWARASTFMTPPLKACQAAIFADAALRKNAQHIALAQHLGRRIKGRAIRGGILCLRRNRNGLGQLEQQAQHGQLEDAVVH